jgi:hypothetical protein
MQIGEAPTEEADTETVAAVVDGCSGGPNNSTQAASPALGQQSPFGGSLIAGHAVERWILVNAAH